MKKEKIYTGSSKSLYDVEDDYTLLLSFDDGIRVSPDKTIDIAGKGVLCNAISAFLMEKLDLVGIDNHFLEKKNMRQQLVQFVDVYPVQVRVANIAMNRYVTDFGMEEGFVFDSPIIDFRVKNSKLNYPIINESQIKSFGWLSKQEIKELQSQAIRVHDFLTGIFAGVGIRLVECYLEFGRVFNGGEFITMLIDEISPDNLSLWDMDTNSKLSFELAKENPERIIPAYNEILQRLNIAKGDS